MTVRAVRAQGAASGAKAREAAAALRILVLHGPNLNLLGQREPDLYGSTSLADVDARLGARARQSNAELSSFQSNHEGALVDRVQAARSDGTRFILINAGAYTHTSIALRDALIAAAVPFIEIHVTNVHAREAFRQVSCLADKAVGTIAGLGVAGYELALEYVLNHATSLR